MARPVGRVVSVETDPKRSFPVFDYLIDERENDPAKTFP